MPIDFEGIKSQIKPDGDPHPPRLVRAAREFEGLMMKELLQPMMQGEAIGGRETDSDSEGGSNHALSEFATESFGQALSQRGGFGIADSILKTLPESGTHSGPQKVTSSVHFDTAPHVLK